jgi:hypothetical protein
MKKAILAKALLPMLEQHQLGDITMTSEVFITYHGILLRLRSKIQPPLIQ